jgi:hypothetical protein
MREWIEGLVGPDYAVPVMAGAAAIIALILLFIVWRLIRHFSAGTFVAGGRNRKTRLAVMDATAIDNHRRLVLVRRDDVEHLLLIGGAADVVVERDIRLAGQVRRPVPPTDLAVDVQLVPEPAPTPRPAAVRPPPPAAQPRPATAHAPSGNVNSLARPAPPPAMRPAPPAARPASAAPVRSAMPPAKSLDDDFDDELLRELEVELDADKPAPPAKAPAVSLDDEMTRLLGELSSNKR